MARPPATFTAEEFAAEAGVSESTVRLWARQGFPGAAQVPHRGKTMWRFEKRIAAKYAKHRRAAESIFSA